MSKKTLKVGLIGLGWMGRLHTRSYKQLAERFPELNVQTELFTACDAQEENRRIAVEELGYKKAVSDYREVMADPQVDIVSICAPNFLHKEIALAAAAAGKPFWIEKPMGVCAEESAQIALAAQKAGVATAVGFNYRHTPAVEKAREIVRAGRIGRITNVRAWLIADYASNPGGPLTWRYDTKRAGAGVIPDLMCHGADLIQYILGDRISRLCASTGIFINERPIPIKEGVGHTGWEVSDRKGKVDNEDYVAALIELSAGAIGTLESSRVANGPRAEYIVEIYGTEGSLRWNFEFLNDLWVCLAKDREFTGYKRVMAGPDFPNFLRFQPGAGTSMGFDDMKAVEAAQFVSSVIDGAQNAPSVGDGWAAAEVGDAMVRSVSSGAWETVRQVSVPTTFEK